MDFQSKQKDNRIVELLEELKTIETSFLSFREEVEVLQEDSKNEQSILTSKLNELHRKLALGEGCQHELRTAEKTCESLKRELSHMKRQVDSLQSKIGRESSLNEKRQMQQEECHSRVIRDLESTMKTNQEQEAELSQLKNQLLQKDYLETRIAEMEDAITCHEENDGKLKEELLEKEMQIKNLEGKVTDLGNGNELLSQDLSSLERELKDKNRQQEENKEALKILIEEFKVELCQGNATNTNELESDDDDDDTSFDSLNIQEAILSLCCLKKICIQKISLLKQEKDQMSKEFSSSLDCFQHEILACERKSISYLEELEGNRDEKRKLIGKLEDALCANVQVVNENSEQQSRHKMASDELKSKIHLLEIEISNQNSKISHKEKTIQFLEESLSKSEEAHMRNNETVSVLEQTQRISEQEFSNYYKDQEQEVESLDHKITLLKRELSMVQQAHEKKVEEIKNLYAELDIHKQRDSEFSVICSRISELEHLVKGCETKIRHQKKHIATLQEEKIRITDSYEREVSDLQNLNTNLLERLECAEKNEIEAKKIHEALEIQLKDVNSLKLFLENKSIDLNNDIQENEGEIVKLSELLTQGDQGKQESVRRTYDVALNLHMKTHLEEVLSQNKVLVSENQKVKNELDMLKASYDQLNNSMKEFSLRAINEEISPLKQDINISNENIRDATLNFTSPKGSDILQIDNVKDFDTNIRDNVKDYESEFDKLVDINRKLESDNADYQRELRDKIDKIEQLKRTAKESNDLLNETNEKMSILKKELQTSDLNLQKYKQLLDSLQEKNEELMSLQSNLEHKAYSLSHKLIEANEGEKKLEEVVKAHLKEIDNLYGQNKQLKDQAYHYEISLSNLKEEISSLHSEKLVMSKDLQSYQDEVAKQMSLSQNLTKKLKEVTIENENLKIMEENVKKYSNKLKNCEADAEKRLKEMELKLANANKQIETYNEVTETLEQQIKRYKQNSESSNELNRNNAEKIKVLREKIKLLEEEIEEYLSEKKLLKEEKVALSELLERKEEEMKTQLAYVKEYERRVEDEKKENVALHQKINTLSTSHEEDNQRMIQLKRSFSKERENQASLVESLRKELSNISLEKKNEQNKSKFVIEEKLNMIKHLESRILENEAKMKQREKIIVEKGEEMNQIKSEMQDIAIIMENKMNDNRKEMERLRQTAKIASEQQKTLATIASNLKESNLRAQSLQDANLSLKQKLAEAEEKANDELNKEIASIEEHYRKKFDRMHQKLHFVMERNMEMDLELRENALALGRLNKKSKRKVYEFS